MCQDCQPELQLYQCIDGENAFTITTAAFTMPAELGGVTIQVSDVGQFTGKWASPGQIIYISSGLLTNGYFTVVSSNSTSISVINSENTSSGNYTQNAPPGTIFPIGSKVSPAGIQGPAGATGSSGASGSPGPAGTNGTNGVAVIDTLWYDVAAKSNTIGGAPSTFGSPAVYSTIDHTLWMDTDGDELIFEAIIISNNNAAKNLTDVGVIINSIAGLGGYVPICVFLIANGADGPNTKRAYRIKGKITRISATTLRAESLLIPTEPAVVGAITAGHFYASADSEVSSVVDFTTVDISCPSFAANTYLLPVIGTPNIGDYSLIHFSVWGLKKV